ncbi:MAG: GAF domain-containing protein, partial [Thermodesulfobacteriota bacterium]|nr:GAF domain-containing protein [Thermodesulfobacteriota bacterium]
MSTAGNRKAFRPSLHITIGSLFVALILTVGGVLSWYHFRVSSKNSLAAAEQHFSRIGRELAMDFIQVFSPVVRIVEFRALSPVMQASNLEERLRYLPEFQLALEQVASMTGLQVGYPNGDYFLVKLIRSAEDLANLGAPAETHLVVDHIAEGRAGKRFRLRLFFDKNLQEIQRNKPVVTDFDTSQRPWYKLAHESGTIRATSPYLFHFSRKVGSTISVQDKKTGGVVGADITLESISKVIGSYQITPGSEVALLGKAGHVVAYTDVDKLILDRGEQGFTLAKLTDLGHPVLTTIDLNENLEPHFFTIEVGGESWRGEILSITVSYGIEVRLLIVAPEDELLAGAIKSRRQTMLITLLILLLSLPVAWLVAQMVARPLQRLSLEAGRISRFDFSRSQSSESVIKEVNDLSSAMGFMEKTISEFLVLIDSLNKEKNFDPLLERITSEAGQAAGADGVVTYLLSDDQNELKPAVIHGADAVSKELTGQLPSLAMGGRHGLVRAARSNEVSITLLDGDDKAVYSRLVSVSKEQDLTMVGLPLQDRQENSMGVIGLLYVHQREKQPERTQDDRIAFVQKMSSLAGVLLETRQLLRMQKELFDSFIKLIAGAIDAKSPYTGGHCQRVPVIAKMLARAACETKDGVFTDFNLSEEQWEELHVAAWLHDCGKVTTPEYVVDKATKLETIYDRIHEVRMRFEVLKRDAEIACWREIAETGEKESRLAQLAKKITQLDDDFAFIAQCNEGGEFMAPELIDRLQEIAQNSWQRTLDDRIGISWEEGQRKQRSPAPELPITEKLLSDKEEHLILREEGEKISSDNPWGFKVDEPEYRYNRGEVYNLQVARGTLSHEERFKINDH